MGGKTSLEIPNGTTPTVDAAGEIAIDTDADGNLVDQGLIVYHDGVQKMYVIAVDALPSNDDYALCYDATNDKFVFQAQTGAGGGASAALDNLASVAINTDLLLGTSDAAALGSVTKQWSDLFLAEGGVINWDNGDATLTQVGDVLTLAGADLKISSPGTAANSVATIDATQTLTNKTHTSPLFQGTVDGWISANETFTYASATTVTVSGDQTTKYYKGMKVKLTQTTVKYFVIAIAPTYSAPNTTLTLHPYDSTTSVANAAITLNYYSTAELPTGFPDRPKVKVLLGSDQLNLANGVHTDVLLDTEVYDIGANFASNVFTAPVSGYYSIYGQVAYLAASVIADMTYVAEITLNASTRIAQYYGTPSAVKEFTCPISVTYYVSRGETIKLTAYQASGADTVDIDGHGSTGLTYLEVRFLEN